MGGRALQNYGVFTERKSTEEFTMIGLEIQAKLNEHFNDMLETKIVTCYHEKESHGDLDLLIKIDHYIHNQNINFRELIEFLFKPQAIHNNGGVYSFDYKNFQVDFIPVKESNWEVALVYFSYDPLGNAMGKTFHKFNLSYGWDGLKYKYRNFNGRNSHDITITKDPRKIFEFGGFDYDRYLQGFDTIEEIFDFIIDGKYFNADIFRMENLNHIDRKRNKKRKSYHEFLNYVEEKKITKFYSFFMDKTLYHQFIEQDFPEINFMEKLAVLDEKNRINQLLNLKLNGRLIMTWIPDLQGKELGDAIRNFRESKGENYNDLILNSDENEIKTMFLDFYENYGKRQ